MNDELKQQIENDIQLAKTMTDINSVNDSLDLTNRLISYQDLLMSSISQSEYECSQMKGKLKTLQEYMRTAKLRTSQLYESERVQGFNKKF